MSGLLLALAAVGAWGQRAVDEPKAGACESPASGVFRQCEQLKDVKKSLTNTSGSNCFVEIK